MEKKLKNSSNSILCGIVLPTEWDTNGRVMRISINTHDESEYIIDYSGQGKELINHLKEMIEIEGKVIKRLSGHSYVKVSSFNVVSA